jgi:glucosamine-phosphate N-acetyltransferase
MNFILQEVRNKDLPELMVVLESFRPVGLSLVDLKYISRERMLGGIKTYVVKDGESGPILGTASLIIEHKFIHNGSYCGHIEDVVVHPDFRDKGVGLWMVQEVTKMAFACECYKVILSCDSDLIEFYSKCGFKQSSVEMRINRE